MSRMPDWFARWSFELELTMKHSLKTVTVTFMSTLYLLPFTSQMDVPSLVRATFFWQSLWFLFCLWISSSAVLGVYCFLHLPESREVSSEERMGKCRSVWQPEEVVYRQSWSYLKFWALQRKTKGQKRRAQPHAKF